ncbi:FecR family protein [Flagellimonas taeanensis]|uniref:FecR family protein n=1 Tax=Flagellimonas taeanensis TaxID=1005926 RepID=A0A1M6W791_9FLAO|nr:FecR family protein [Allomuricauda taeanensis]SFC45629.1 FecR family protein [Allomuricauda taeanensis]SHK89690.1 FecR family protein [Allomuricauda taeanensis]
MTEKRIKGLMEKYLNGTITKKEESLLERFDGRLLSKNHKDVFKDERHRKQIERLLSQNISRPRKRISLPKWARVAASIALMAVVAYSVHVYTKVEEKVEPIVEMTKTTEWGQKLNLSLADGTQIRLNSGSTITYPDRFEGDVREVVLEGEAFFDVAKNPDKPFVIRSGEVLTTVLGTSFNINTYPDSQQIAVTVASGKVKVASHENEIHLGPNEQGIFDKKTKTISKKMTDIATFLNWKDGIIHFEDTSLAQVVESLERWYGVTFVFENENLRNCHVTATYKNEMLPAVMESIAYAKKGLRYEFLENDKILIKGKCTD